MLFRRIIFATATIAALSPAISNAAAERASLKACAAAFATSLAAPGATTPAFKVNYLDAERGTWAYYYPTEFTFTMEAHDAKSGATIARARCSADNHGVVKDIATLPLETTPATLAAR
jgi:hypothetical protein